MGDETTTYSISSGGEIQETIGVTSADGKISIDITEGTVALDEEGNPLTSLTFTVDKTPPPAPPEAYIVGIPYDVGPSGATFDTPITLTWSYDPADILPGVAEEDLVLAYYDEAAGEWVELPSTVNLVANTITASVSHFTIFAIIGVVVTPSPPPVAPAVFTTSGLSVSPTEVDIGESVTISIRVTNTGDLAGSYEVTLKIDNAAVDTKTVTLAGGAKQTVTFTTAKDDTGTYSVDVNGLSGTFTVKAAPAPVSLEPAAFTTSDLTISPTEVEVGETVTISIRVTNTGDLAGSYEVTLKIDNAAVDTKTVTLAGGAKQTVTFTTDKDTSGTYSVDVNGLSGTLTVEIVPAPAPVKPINWGLIVGIIVGIIAIVASIFLPIGKGGRTLRLTRSRKE